VIGQELGLIGTSALLLLYMVFVLRGVRIALLAEDGFSKLLAAGLTFGFALQTFIIVGGIERIIPLTGITLPFVSYGRSSVVVKHVSGQTLYFRRYPTGPLFAHVVGYSTQSKNQTGLEESYNDFLTASNANLDTVFHSTLDRLKGSAIVGNNLILSLRPGVQA